MDLLSNEGEPLPEFEQEVFDVVDQCAFEVTLTADVGSADEVEQVRAATKNNVVRQRAFSDRISDLMRRYTNQQLTSAEVIAELIAMAKDVAAESDRGKHFTPPLSNDELAFYDAVAQNESGASRGVV